MRVLLLLTLNRIKNIFFVPGPGIMYSVVPTWFATAVFFSCFCFLIIWTFHLYKTNILEPQYSHCCKWGPQTKNKTKQKNLLLLLLQFSIESTHPDSTYIVFFFRKNVIFCKCIFQLSRKKQVFLFFFLNLLYPFPLLACIYCACPLSLCLCLSLFCYVSLETLQYYYSHTHTQSKLAPSRQHIVVWWV